MVHHVDPRSTQVFETTVHQSRTFRQRGNPRFGYRRTDKVSTKNQLNGYTADSEEDPNLHGCKRNKRKYSRLRTERTTQPSTITKEAGTNNATAFTPEKRHAELTLEEIVRWDLDWPRETTWSGGSGLSEDERERTQAAQCQTPPTWPSSTSYFSATEGSSEDTTSVASEYLSFDSEPYLDRWPEIEEAEERHLKELIRTGRTPELQQTPPEIIVAFICRLVDGSPSSNQQADSAQVTPEEQANLRCAFDTLYEQRHALKTEQPLVSIAFDYDLSKRDILEYYLKKRCDQVIYHTETFFEELITPKARTHKQLEADYLAIAAIAAFKQSQSPHEHAQAAIAQLLRSPLLSGLKKHLEDTFCMAHARHLIQSLHTLKLERASPVELLQAREQFRLLDLIQNKIPKKLKLRELNEKRLRLSAIIICRFLRALPAPHHQYIWYQLAPTSEAYIYETLSSYSDTEEKQFFNAVLKYIDATQTCESNDCHENVRKWSQCRHDLFDRLKQLLVMIADQIISKQQNLSPLRTSNNAESNIRLAEQAARESRKLGPRPMSANSGLTPIVSTVVDSVFELEKSFKDIEADLYYKKLLIDSDYNFYEEVNKIFQISPRECIQKFVNYLCSGDKSCLKKIKELIVVVQEATTKMQAIAQRNPRHFRHEMGKIFTLYARFKSLFSADPALSDAYNIFMSSLKGHALGAAFTQDIPSPIINCDPEEIDTIKQFQMCCDIAGKIHEALDYYDIFRAFWDFSPNRLIRSLLPTYVSELCFEPMRPTLIRWLYCAQYAEHFLYYLVSDMPGNAVSSLSLYAAAERARYISQTGNVIKHLRPAITQAYTVYDLYKQAVTEPSDDTVNWKRLRLEFKKTTGILILSLFLAASVTALAFMVGIFSIFASPIIAAVITGISLFTSSFNKILYLQNQTERLTRPVKQAVSDYVTRKFSEDSEAAREAKKCIQEVSQTIVQKMQLMTKESPHQDYDIYIELSRYWEQFWGQSPNKDRYLKAVVEDLEKPSIATQLKVDAVEIQKYVNDIKVMEDELKALDEKPDTPSIEDINDQIICPSLKLKVMAGTQRLRVAIEDQLTLKNKLAKMTLIKMCGTEAPGSDLPTIIGTLKTHLQKVAMGMWVKDKLQRISEMHILLNRDTENHPFSPETAWHSTHEQVEQNLLKKRTLELTDLLDELRHQAVSCALEESFRGQSEIADDDIEKAFNDPQFEQRVTVILLELLLARSYRMEPP